MYIKRLVKKQLRITIIIVVLVALLVVGSSYALFETTVSNPTDQTLSVGDLSITFNGGSAINISSLDPYTDAVALTKSDNIYTFSVQNTGTVAYTYTIKLEDNPAYLSGGASYSASMTLLNHNYIRYSLDSSAAASLGSVNNLIYSGTINPGKTKSFSLRLWVADPTTYNLPNEALGSEIHLNINVDGKASANAHEFIADTSGANEPLLADNMIPVYYDNTNDVWVKADVNNANATYKWHDYDAQMWANAVTVTSTTRSTYTSAAVGTQIPMSDILGMWVWIPRYEYMTTNLGTNYAGGTQALPGGISIKFISGTSTTNDTNYLIHPAFRNGTVYKYSADYDLGGWDKELTGFWMSKFETGYATNNTTNAAISSNILVKPDVYSMRYQKVSNEYTTVANIQSDHGIGSTVETHMSKNDEWGAVAYLSQSTYGKYGNTSYTGANKEVYVNNAVDSSYTYYTTGRSNRTYARGTGSGTAQYGTYEYNNCPASAYTHTTCTEAVRNTNNIKGTGASTTGNIYGVYDMSGGAYEYVMANLSGTIRSSGFSSMPAQKYWNKYTSTTQASACNGSSCYGQAITETSGWYNDGMIFVSSTSPWAYHGNVADDASYTFAGVFNFYVNDGGALNYSGVRASIS